MESEKGKQGEKNIEILFKKKKKKERNQHPIIYVTKLEKAIRIRKQCISNAKCFSIEQTRTKKKKINIEESNPAPEQNYVYPIETENK